MAAKPPLAANETEQRVATIVSVSEESAQSLEQQLEEIRTQLAWVRDYL
jgi:hypothetical protein